MAQNEGCDSGLEVRVDRSLVVLVIDADGFTNAIGLEISPAKARKLAETLLIAARVADESMPGLSL